MPPINPAAVSAGIAAVTVAVAAAIALYESDDVRRYTEQIRRRIAVALHSLGNELDPGQTRNLEPLFNRPEDADGFLMSSRGGAGADSTMEADEETRKRQRDELMYWNAIRESQLEERSRQDGAAPPTRSRGASFDDFLQPDSRGGEGTLVMNTGADTNVGREGLVRRNVGVAGGVAGLSAGLYANPFSDDQHMMDDDDDERLAGTMLAPSVDEMSDIYSATTPDHNSQKATPPASPAARSLGGPVLIDLESNESASTASQTLDFEREEEREQESHHGQGEAQDADRSNLFAVIGAWAEAADTDNRDRAVSPPSSASSFSDVGGARTPDRDDGFSVADGEAAGVEVDAPASDLADEVGSEGAAGDVLSVSDGMFTPAGWSEVGSVVSESELSMRGRA
ncbi:uncharacterized protein DNG_08581 [Cephalotrichum gorgonifer]|uniref:Uncharacterized protein n=1 Tax=Cephalotrichum gorgonifer TaxID=2041049 RepID=A0AAE8N6Q7_9PEZI|nr:uncharacterized protein DNG_08581 [Cephalotrichum gorgonifer]